MDTGIEDTGFDLLESMQAEPSGRGAWQPPKGVGEPGTVFTAARTGEWEVREYIEKGAYGSVHKVFAAAPPACSCVD